MAFVEDLDQFFSEKDFADAAEFWRGNVKLLNASVIFDAPMTDRIYDDISVTEDAPTLLVKTALIADLKRGDLAILAVGKFQIEQIHDDGTGVTRLELSNAWQSPNDSNL